MENSIQPDAELEQQIDLVTDVLEDSEGSSFDVDYIEEKEVEETGEEAVEEEESQEEAPEIEDVPNKENPSRFEYWQAKFSHEQNARKELEEKLQSLAEKLEKPNTPEPEPLKPPVKPTDPDDQLAKLDYVTQLAEYQAKIIEQQQEAFAKQQQAQQQAQRDAEFKAYMLGQYQKHGADEKLSAEAFNFFSSEQSLDPKTQLEMLIAWKGAPKPNPKVNQMKDRSEKHKIPLPPGVAKGGEQYPTEPDFGSDLVTYTKNNRV